MAMYFPPGLVASPPGVPVQFPAVIDRQNPLTRDIRHLWMPTPGNPLRDIMIKSPEWSALTTDSKVPVLEPVQGVQAAVFNGSDMHLETVATNFPFGGAGTNVVYCIIRDNTLDGNIMQSGSGHELISRPAAVRFKIASGGQNISVVQPAENKWLILAGGWDGAEIFVYADGVYDTFATVSLPPSTFEYVIGSAPAAVDVLDGAIAYVAFFDRYWSLDELRLLSADPGQLVMPAFEMPVFSAVSSALDLDLISIMALGRPYFPLPGWVD